MTKKRFHSESNCIGYYTEIIDEQKKLDLTIPNPKKNLLVEELVDLLNALYEENEQLKRQIFQLKLLVQNWEALDNEKDEQLNRQNKALIQLKEEKENWKLNACDSSSFNSILLHELDLAQEQGYKLSDPFKKLMGEKE